MPTGAGTVTAAAAAALATANADPNALANREESMLTGMNTEDSAPSCRASIAKLTIKLFGQS